MVRYFLAILLIFVTSSLMGQAIGDLSHNDSVDKVTLVDFDLSAKNGAKKDDAQDDIDPLDFIVSTYQPPQYLYVLPEHYINEQPFLVAQLRYSIKTRAPPLIVFA